MENNWATVRAEFPSLARWTYLNTATFGQVPRRAVAAVEEHFARRDRYACTDFMDWFDDMDRIRQSAAQLVRCTAADIAFVPNASSALSLLLGGLDWRSGDEVVTLEHEFPNHYYYPSHLGGAGIRFVETPWERFYDSLTARTRVVAISEVNYSTGFRAPLEEVAPELRRRGILLYIDGTQSTGALQFDVGRIQPDLFAVHAYKWMLSPNGAGFMYVSPALRERLAPNVIGWRSHKDWRNPERLHHGAPEFRTEAEKYEGGMITFGVLYAMDAVIRMMLDIGTETIERRVVDLADKTRALLRRQGACLLADELPHHDSQVVCGAIAGRDASDLVRRLAGRNVLVAARQGNLRVSPHFYNDEGDLDRLEEALASTR
jgi:selenocysteine lyase/cysteine desulfurase